MRTIPAALQARLDTGCTTLATCWVLTRRDGAVMGFTDHDGDLTVEGVVCRADTGLDGAAAAEKLGFATAGGEVAGALVSEALTEADIAAGLYDGAKVAVHLVDWSEPALSLKLRAMTVGEIVREGAAFRAELRSLSQGLDVERGRLYSPRCSADLGDARCGVSLAGEGRAGTGTVAAVPAPAILVCAGLGGFAPPDLAGGRLTVTSGAAAGYQVEIADHAPDDAGARLTLWQPPPAPLAPGDAVAVTVGCDKLFATCRDRFANALNFRGFPHMPGNDRLLAVPVPGEGGYDGGSLQT